MKNLRLLDSYDISPLCLVDNELNYNPNINYDGSYDEILTYRPDITFVTLCKYDTDLKIEIGDNIYIEGHNMIHECIGFENNGDIITERLLPYQKDKCHKVVGSNDTLLEKEILDYIKTYNKSINVTPGNETQLLKVEVNDLYDFIEYLFNKHINDITQEEAYSKFKQFEDENV